MNEIQILNKALPAPFGARQWRDIPGFEGRYMVSDDGHVGSLRRPVSTGKGRTRWVRTKILNPTVRKKNGKVWSVCVHLCREGEKTLGANVGRLVLLAFTGEQDGQLAHYKDGDPTNNNLSNMEWTSMPAIAVKAINGGYMNEARIQGRLTF